MAFGKIPTSSGSEENEEMAEINIIPLVDVMLVLLIIFMVTAPLSIGGIKVQLPNTKAKGAAVAEDRIVLSITKSGQYYIEKSQIPSTGLPAKFKAIYEFREKKELYIRADTGVAYGNVVYAMSAAKGAGVSKLSMLTKNKGGR
jgi:biopolymer transport protein TolR